MLSPAGQSVGLEQPSPSCLCLQSVFLSLSTEIGDLGLSPADTGCERFAGVQELVHSLLAILQGLVEHKSQGGCALPFSSLTFDLTVVGDSGYCWHAALALDRRVEGSLKAPFCQPKRPPPSVCKRLLWRSRRRAAKRARLPVLSRRWPEG